jgi:hypothetical protein
MKFMHPEFLDSLHTVLRLLALHTGHLYTTPDITGTHLFWRLSRTQGRSAAGRIKSEKNVNDPMIIELATFRLVEYYLNQLRYHVLRHSGEFIASLLLRSQFRTQRCLLCQCELQISMERSCS